MGHVQWHSTVHVMDMLTYVPRQPLAEFIELLWLYKRKASAHTKERLLPTGHMELVMDLRDNTPGPLLCGAHSKPCVIDTEEPATIVGVHFKPGGAFPFLNLPAGELSNEHVSLNAVWGRTAEMLRDRLLEATSPAAKFRVLEQSLLRQAHQSLARHPAIAFALSKIRSEWPLPTIAELTTNIGLSPRRFIQLFTDEVGLTPKLFCRITRFQRALRLIDNQSVVEWAPVAVSCGYYDQAHFIHDFQAFSGLKPTAYLKIRGEHMNHVPLRN